MSSHWSEQALPDRMPFPSMSGWCKWGRQSVVTMQPETRIPSAPDLRADIIIFSLTLPEQSFDLEAHHPGLEQLGQKLDGAEVTGGEMIARLFAVMQTGRVIL